VVIYYTFHSIGSHVELWDPKTQTFYSISEYKRLAGAYSLRYFYEIFSVDVRLASQSISLKYGGFAQGVGEL